MVTCLSSTYPTSTKSSNYEYLTVTFRSPDVPQTPRQRVGPREPGHRVLPDAARHGPHSLRRARRPTRPRGTFPRGLMDSLPYDAYNPIPLT